MGTMIDQDLMVAAIEDAVKVERKRIVVALHSRAKAFEDAQDYGDRAIRVTNRHLARQFREFARELGE